MIDILLAFLAGLVTVAAPCILPILPILLGASVGHNSPARPVFIALGFILAFSGLALVFAAFTDAFGLSHDTLRNVAIALLLTFGILMFWKRPLQLLSARIGPIVNRAGEIGSRVGPGNVGGLVLGMTLGAVWTPCAGPVLGSILTLVATADDTARASALLVFYAIGAGVPMLLIAYGGQVVTTRVRRLARYAERVQQVFGALIVLTAVAMYYQYDSLVTLWLSNFYLNLQPGS